jgi:glycosyltransferase involved in cell wall biosynthesis
MKNEKIAISVVIFTKNEESNIRDCINSVVAFSEVVVVDSISSDKTCDIAKRMGAQIIDFNWNGKYPKKRQWSLENISFQNNWILFLDADERIDQKLTFELENFIKNDSSNFSAGSLPIEYYFAGKKMRFGQRPRKTVLLRTDYAHFPIIPDLSSQGMGELEGHYQPIVTGKVKKFNSTLIHNDNDLIASWVIRHANYAKWEAYLLVNPEAKNRVDSSKGLAAGFFHKLPFRPFAFFCYSYFLKFGFLDGKVGFDYAFAKSWYYWLSGVMAREGRQSAK